MHKHCVPTFIKLLTWQFGHAILPKIPDGNTPGNLQLHLVKYSRLLLTCTVVQLSYNFLKHDVRPCMHHYSIYCFWIFLWVSIFGHLDSTSRQRRDRKSVVVLMGTIKTTTTVGIDIWSSGLKHCNKFKHVILRFIYMCNPVLFAIPHEVWIPYHNFWASLLYNKVKYD